MQKQKNQYGEIFQFFSFLIFVSFEMFAIHVLKQRNCYEKILNQTNRYIQSDLNQGVNVRVSHLTFLLNLCLIVIYFSDIYINAKINNHINFQAKINMSVGLYRIYDITRLLTSLLDTKAKMFDQRRNWFHLISYR